MNNIEVKVGARVGLLKQEVINILKVNLSPAGIFLLMGGIKHIRNKRYRCFRNYLNEIPEIIKNPEYVGTNPKYPNSVEFLKNIRGKNVLVAINTSPQKILKVSTMYTVTSSKLTNMLEHKRIKKFR